MTSYCIRGSLVDVVLDSVSAEVASNQTQVRSRRPALALPQGQAEQLKVRTFEPKQLCTSFKVIMFVCCLCSSDLSKLGSLLPDPSTRHSGLISPSSNRIYLLEGPVHLSTVRHTFSISLLNLARLRRAAPIGLVTQLRVLTYSPFLFCTRYI